MMRAVQKTLRSAIYTRVSTDQGLEQEFNSLDNQREAAEAYIKSQAHEGWRCLPARYDDGGFSGGCMQRPALQRLLSDIRAHAIDVVVVYKVDRLTRSLADFAKLVEIFDQHDVSFVSVTQAFNTTNSMGRLTLNVLLSFAQFEREVTAERIRDKIAASKRKGMHMGGLAPLGYDVHHKKLVINPDEADRVRLIFRRYLELGCLTKLMRDLEERRVLTKVARLSSGAKRGGIFFTKGPLAYLLKNRVYLGEIAHKGRYFPGEHEPILDQDLFDTVQQQLASQAQRHGSARANQASLLTGRIFDDRGNRMTPSSAKRNGAYYRYYVSAPISQGRKEQAGSVPRVPAPDLEALVVRALRAHAPQPDGGGEDRRNLSDRDLVEQFCPKITVRRGAVEITLNEGESDRTLLIDWSPPPARTRRELIVPEGSGTEGEKTSCRPIRSESRARLVEAIAKGRLWVDELVSGRMASTRDIADREGLSERSVRMTLGLAFLSPRLVQATVDGALPFGSGLSRLTDLPPCWDQQLRAVHDLTWSP